MTNFYEAIDANKRRSFIVVVSFLLFTGLAIYILTSAMNYYFDYQMGGIGIAGVALIISGISSFAGYWWSDKMVLAISGAKPANGTNFRTLYDVTQNLSMVAQIPMPKLYVIDDSATNAFATGRDPQNAAICITSGLVEKLDRTELEGVIGHEMTHIRNYDTRLLSVVAILVGSLALLSDIFFRMTYFGGRRKSDDDNNQLGVIIFILGIAFAILSPLIAQLIQLAISRRREFLADAGSVSLTRQPSGLISALKKLTADTDPLEAANKATAHLYIVNPFKNPAKGGINWFSGLFNTHPPIEERIAALEAM